jgi:ribosomal protein L37AE/L43A
VDDHVTAEYSCAQQDRVQRKYTSRWDCQRCEYKPESVK